MSEENSSMWSKLNEDYQKDKNKGNNKGRKGFCGTNSVSAFRDEPNKKNCKESYKNINRAKSMENPKPNKKNIWEGITIVAEHYLEEKKIKLGCWGVLSCSTNHPEKIIPGSPVEAKIMKNENGFFTELKLCDPEKLPPDYKVRLSVGLLLYDSNEKEVLIGENDSVNFISFIYLLKMLLNCSRNKDVIKKKLFSDQIYLYMQEQELERIIEKGIGVYEYMLKPNEKGKMKEYEEKHRVTIGMIKNKAKEIKERDREDPLKTGYAHWSAIKGNTDLSIESLVFLGIKDVDIKKLYEARINKELKEEALEEKDIGLINRKIKYAIERNEFIEWQYILPETRELINEPKSQSYLERIVQRLYVIEVSAVKSKLSSRLKKPFEYRRGWEWKSFEDAKKVFTEKQWNQFEDFLNKKFNKK